jgi:hypothetical protein
MHPAHKFAPPPLFYLHLPRQNTCGYKGTTDKLELHHYTTAPVLYTRAHTHAHTHTHTHTHTPPLSHCDALCYCATLCSRWRCKKTRRHGWTTVSLLVKRLGSYAWRHKQAQTPVLWMVSLLGTGPDHVKMQLSCVSETRKAFFIWTSGGKVGCTVLLTCAQWWCVYAGYGSMGGWRVMGAMSCYAETCLY